MSYIISQPVIMAASIIFMATTALLMAKATRAIKVRAKYANDIMRLIGARKGRYK